MRGKLVFTVMFVCFGVMSISCVTPATEDELTSMCDNLVQLRGEISNPSVETIASDIAVRFDEETKKLEDSRIMEQRALNEELQAKLDAAEKEEERSKIQEEYAAKLKASATKHQPEIAAMSAKKKEAVAEAKKQAQENREVWNDAVNECVAQAKKEGVGQEIARCRIQAENTDKYWNGCR